MINQTEALVLAVTFIGGILLYAAYYVAVVAVAKPINRRVRS